LEKPARDSGLLSEADLELIRGAAERSARENERERVGLARRLEASRAEALRLAGLMAVDPELERVPLFGFTSNGRQSRTGVSIAWTPTSSSR
jgi:hypothetical protein